MPPEGVQLSPPAHILSDEEVIRLASLFVRQGVDKIRLTGGEPTIRKNLPQIISEQSNQAPLLSLKRRGSSAR
jgi:molybdenum cofactor biosynthesis enzyme MoaA